MEIYVECPHCGDMIEIIEINCGIFRHGAFINNGEQLNPHAPEIFCKEVFGKGLIYGCGKPFQLLSNEGTYNAVKCEYI